jgi:Zn ribbon nucleic-acid-binding protein
VTELEHCPKCTEGVLHALFDTDEAEGKVCLHCGNTFSQVKSGYEVTSPGEPITKIETKSSKAGSS